MARETKVGLLLALGVVLLIGVIAADHLAVTQPQAQQDRAAAAVAEFAPAAQRGIQPTPTAEPSRVTPSPSPTEAPRRNAPRLIAPDRFAEPDLGPPARQRPDIQAAELPTPSFAESASPPPAWRKVEPSPVRPNTNDAFDPRANEPPRELTSTGLFVDADAARTTDPNSTGVLQPITIVADASPAPAAPPTISVVQPSISPATQAIVQAGPVPQPERDARTIVVQAGDSLSRLAERHLGSQSKYFQLFEANRDVLDSPDHVVVGMRLQLPRESAPGQTAAESTPTPTVTAEPTPPARPAARTYTVVSGDNLSKIAEKTLGSRDRWDELFEANRDRLDTPDRVRAGQELRIPG